MLTGMWPNATVQQISDQSVGGHDGAGTEFSDGISAVSCAEQQFFYRYELTLSIQLANMICSNQDCDMFPSNSTWKSSDAIHMCILISGMCTYVQCVSHHKCLCP